MIRSYRRPGLTACAVALAITIAGCQPAPSPDRSAPTLPGATVPGTASPTPEPSPIATASPEPTSTVEPDASPIGPPKSSAGANDAYVARFGNCPEAERLLPDELAEGGVTNEAAGGNTGIETHPFVAPFLEASGASLACNAFGASPDSSGLVGGGLIVMPVEIDDPAAMAQELVNAAANAIDPETGDPIFHTPSEVVTVEADGQTAVGVVGSHPDVIVGPNAVVLVWPLPASIEGDDAATRAFFVQLGNLEPRS